MKNTMKTLNEIYKVNGENGKYATMYESEEELIEISGDVESFIERFDVNPQRKLSAETLSYPFITFDTSASIGGELFEVEQIDDILDVASDYFDKK